MHVKMDSETVARMIERGQINEEDIGYHIQETIEIPHDVEDVEEYCNTHGKLLTDRLAVLEQAHMRFNVLSKVSYNSTMDFERYYMALYEDIMEHRDVWFDNFFNVDNPRPTRAEFTTGILGTLCTILRQRGDLRKCNEVMKTYMAVLDRYQQMTEGCGRAAQINCCEGLTYKANIIRINLGVQLPDKKMTGQAFRDAVAFERREKALGRYDVDKEPDNDGVMEMFFGHNRYEELSDDDIHRAFTFMAQGTLDDVDGSPLLKLDKCGCCDKEEKMRGDFKKCTRCHSQKYCIKKCQMKDWKFHKHLCGKKNNTNLGTVDLQFITKQLVKNHTDTVELREGKPLTEFQQNDAKVALVKKLKAMFLGDYTHFNSPLNFNDAAADPAFCSEVAAFFARQPGYEKVWGELCVGYKEQLEAERALKRRTKTLTVPEDIIESACCTIAHNMMIHVGIVMDGNTSKVADPERQKELIRLLVARTKRFLREHPEYDSHANFRNLGKNMDYMTSMGEVMSSVLGVEIRKT